MNKPAPSPAHVASVDLLSVRMHKTQEDLALDAASMARECLCEAIAMRGRAFVVFACASSQIRFLEALVAEEGVDWSRVTAFHMDEYLGISPNHPASFRRFLRERLVERVNPGQTHYLQGDAAQPLAECARYAQLLAAQTIDLCCLGIGENGHIAFNDPPVADFADPHAVKLVKLDEASRQQQVGEGFFLDLAAVPQYSYTLTIPALCAAHKMLCIVPERRKAEAVRRTLNGPISTICPATALRQQSQATLFLDADSASLLDWDQLD